MCSFDYHSGVSRCAALRRCVTWFELNLKDNFFFILWSNTKCAYIIFSYYGKYLIFSGRNDCWWCKFHKNAEGFFCCACVVLAGVRTQLLSICSWKNFLRRHPMMIRVKSYQYHWCCQRWQKSRLLANIFIYLYYFVYGGVHWIYVLLVSLLYYLSGTCQHATLTSVDLSAVV